MKFSNAVTALCLAPNVWAAVASPRQEVNALEVRQSDGTALGTISSALSALEDALPGFEQELAAAITQIEAAISVNAEVVAQVSALISANFGDIATAIQDTAAAIVQVTTNVAGGFAAAVGSLTAQDIAQLEADLQAVANIIGNLQIDVTAIGQIESQLGAAYQAELQNLQAAIQLLTGPLVAFANQAVNSIIANPVLDGTALQASVSALATVTNNLSNSLGLGNVFNIAGNAVTAVENTAAAAVSTVGSVVGTALGDTLGVGISVGANVNGLLAGIFGGLKKH